MKRTTLFILSFICIGHLLIGQENSRFKPMEDVNNVIDLTLDSLEKANTMRPIAGSSRKGDHPVLFLIGNSTMRTGTKGNGDNGQWGWGFHAHRYFDANKITVENHALGGTSSRTFYRKLWPAVKKGIRKGDYVIIELGHNDNGPFDRGRARASIKGVSAIDSLEVVIQETGERETVYSFGEYMRRFIRECREIGAQPILFSLTPRNAWDEKIPGKIARVNTTFGMWSKQIAEEMDVPFIDLNEITAGKFEQFSTWKVNYHFYLDRIHTSDFGARLNAHSAAEGLAKATHKDLAKLQDCLINTTPPAVDVKREKGKPVVFITGDSTVKNEDKNPDGMWGWGSQASTIFDTNKITIANEAMAGRSTRTFLEEKRWEKVYNSLQPGDFVLIQFGHNDIGDIDRGKARGTIACAHDTSHVYRVRANNKVQNQVIYSFGWYLKKFIDDVREKGATPILLSLTPRNEWPDGKIERRNHSYGKWYREVVAATAVEFVDVHNITANALDSIGRKGTKEYYNRDHTHTSLKGAQLNAKSVAKGLRDIDSPLAKYLK
jgi:lysophospholipase L1-like esterase